ncbi:hypothetical protein [Litoreibacter ponti]|nr:hypothetical protein [Litoreibacter ponti]
MLTRPRDVREFLTRLKTCASDRPLAFRLRQEGIRTAIISFSEVVPALRSGSCDVFVGTNFRLAQLDRRLNSDNGPSDDVPPRQPDDAPDDDDVVVDRTPPQITPVQQVFEGKGRSIRVNARITDTQSRIREAFVVIAGGGRVRMSASQGSSDYSAAVELPRDFNDRVVAIVATDAANNSARSRVTLRLVPWCGPRTVVSRALVQDVQENLACVGISPGGADGALGPRTCEAIGGFLKDRMDSFDAGRIRWDTLQQDLRRACLAAQPVQLEVPDRIEIDRAQTTVAVGLRQPGLTQSIRIAGPAVGTQTRPWRGQPVIFDMPMPSPGQDAAYRVQALGAEGNALDTATLRLIRPPALISVQPSGSVTATGARTDFAVSMTRGASAVARIEARQPGASPVGQVYAGGSLILSLQSPAPGASQQVSFVALDRSGNALARQSVTFNGPEPVVPTQLTLESLSGNIVDGETVRLRVVLESPGAASELVIRGGQGMAELARAPVGDRLWDTTHDLPPPGETIAFQVQALDRSGKPLAEDAVRIERAGVLMEVQPSGVFEADTDGLTVQSRVTSGADWIGTIVARVAGQDLVLGESALVQGQGRIRLDMPQPGDTQTVEILAIGRDGRPYAVEQISLVRPARAPALPVTLVVTSPDGFAIDAQNTRLAVQVVNPADTAVIVVSEPESGQVLERIRYSGGDWLGQVPMPEAGARLPLVIEAQNVSGETLAQSRIILTRPAAPRLAVPNLAWIGALILVALGIGYLGARLGGRGRKNSAPDVTVPPPLPKIFAEHDRNPIRELDPVSPPTLMLHVEEGDAPEIRIEMAEDLEVEEGTSL